MCCTRGPGTNDPDVDYRYCPRATLQRVLKQAEESYALDFLVGFEVEFMLMGTSEDGQRYQLLQNGGLWTASACQTQTFVHVQECVETLRSLDVIVQQFQAWGSQNRTTPVRKITQGHWELRLADATANMYLALSACIGAGLLGLQNYERLQWKDCSSWCSKLSDAEKRDLGIATRLPSTLREALECLKETDEDMGGMLGASLVQRYIQLKEGEDKILGSKEMDEVRNIYLRRFC